MSKADLDRFLSSVEPMVVDAAGDENLPLASFAALSTAISMKRIADALDSESVKGSVLYWLEIIASAANAGRS